MINQKTKAPGMIYRSPDGKEHIIYHGYFKVLDFVQVPNENKYKIHIQNKEYDTIIVPFIDSKETLTKPCNIKMAYIITDKGINCHGYEVVGDMPELMDLPEAKHILLEDPEVDINKYKNIISFFLNKISSPQIRGFVNSILEKKAKYFLYWPAATNVHHNIESGLLLHTANVVKTAYSIAFNYSDIDMDLVIAGSILHDIGKIYEYDSDGTVSGEGKLFDHINIGTRILFEEYYHGLDHPYEFSERDLYNLAHIILSHHGRLEWGSSRTPATKEALIVHWADYIDTNMYIIHKELRDLDIDQSTKSKYLGQVVQTKFSTSLEYDKN